LLDTKTCEFLLHDALLAWYMLLPSLPISVHLSVTSQIYQNAKHLIT